MSSEREITISGADTDRQVGFSVRNRESFFLPASEFQGYENTVSGSGEKLLDLLTEQVRHRMEMEKEELRKSFDIKTKQYQFDIMIGSLAVMVFGILAVFFGFMGMEKAAIACVSCPALYGLSSLFRRKHADE